MGDFIKADNLSNQKIKRGGDRKESPCSFEKPLFVGSFQLAEQKRCDIQKRTSHYLHMTKVIVITDDDRLKNVSSLFNVGFILRN